MGSAIAPMWVLLATMCALWVLNLLTCLKGLMSNSTLVYVHVSAEIQGIIACSSIFGESGCCSVWTMSLMIHFSYCPVLHLAKTLCNALCIIKAAVSLSGPCQLFRFLFSFYPFWVLPSAAASGLCLYFPPIWLLLWLLCEASLVSFPSSCPPFGAYSFRLVSIPRERIAYMLNSSISVSFFNLKFSCLHCFLHPLYERALNQDVPQE